METFLRLLPDLEREFRPMLERVAEDHHRRAEIGGRHHDLGHTFRVATTVLVVAPDAVTARLSWTAGALHTTDRLFPDEDISEKLAGYLAFSPLADGEKQIVTRAVAAHARPNGADDDLVSITLKDADRIADFGAIVLFRAAQMFHDKLVYQPLTPTTLSPGSGYQNSKSVVEDIIYVMEWLEKEFVKVRLPKSFELARDGHNFMKSALLDITRQLSAIGMYPLPEAYRQYFAPRFDS